MFQFAHCTFAKINSNLKSIISPDPQKYFDYEIQKFEISFKFKSPLSLSAKPQISPGQNINSDKSMNILFGFHFRNKMSSMPMAHLSVVCTHSMTHLSPAFSKISDLAPDCGILQSELFTSRSLVSPKLPSWVFWRYGQFFK